jgi:hypothetical protein
MKITHLLEAPSKLQAFITKNSTHFQQFGDNYVFIWTDEVLAALRRAGTKSNEDIDTVVVPYEIGLGIVNAATGDVCVGAIDPDYDALWASSSDVSDFFVATGNRKLIRLPNRLQNLADLLKKAAEPESETGGVDAIVDYIDEYGLETVDVEAIKNMDSASEVRDYLEEERDRAQEELDNTKDQKESLLSALDDARTKGASPDVRRSIRKKLETLVGPNSNTVSDIEDILKQKHLFVEPGEDSDTSDVDSEIDSWTRNFNRDFPDLDLPDAREFTPT